MPIQNPHLVCIRDLVAHGVEIAFIPLATFSLILTIGNCVADWILSKNNGPRTRCRNIAVSVYWSKCSITCVYRAMAGPLIYLLVCRISDAMLEQP